MITRHDQEMLAALKRIGHELKRSNDLKEKEMEEAKRKEISELDAD